MFQSFISFPFVSVYTCLWMSSAGDIDADTKPDGHEDFWLRTRRSSNSIDGNNTCFSETDEPLLMCSSSIGSEEEEELGVSELNLQINGEERGFRCRICHLNLEKNYDDSPKHEDSEEDPVELGCSCKGDLGVAHKHCAETWFQIKGDPICEICGSIALNFTFELENEVINIEAASQASEAVSETRGLKYGHLVLTFMIAFLLLTFVISYIFHTKNLNTEH